MDSPSSEMGLFPPGDASATHCGYEDALSQDEEDCKPTASITSTALEQLHVEEVHRICDHGLELVVFELGDATTEERQEVACEALRAELRGTVRIAHAVDEQKQGSGFVQGTSGAASDNKTDIRVAQKQYVA